MASYHTQNLNFLPQPNRLTRDFLSSAPACLSFCSHASRLSSPQNMNTGLFHCYSSIPLSQKIHIPSTFIQVYAQKSPTQRGKTLLSKISLSSHCSFIPLPSLIFLLSAHHYQDHTSAYWPPPLTEWNPMKIRSLNSSSHYRSLKEYPRTCSNTCKSINIMSLQLSWTIPNGKTNYSGGYASCNAISQSG